MSDKDNSHETVNGPNLGQMVCSLILGNPPNRMTVSFGVVGLQTSSAPGKSASMEVPVDVAITSLKQFDGTGDRWIYEGYTRSKLFGGPGKVEGYICTPDRKGWIRFLGA